MGRIRTKDVKDLARDLHEAYPDRFSPDFDQNKQVIGELKIVEGKSKRFRNRVAGYIVRIACQAASGRRAIGERAADEAEIADVPAEEIEELDAQEETKEVADEKSEE